MKQRLFRRFAVAVVLAGAVGSANARDPFQLNLTVGAESRLYGFASIEDAVDQADPARYRSEFSSLTPESDQVSVYLDFRGLTSLLDFAQDSSDLRFQVPAAGIDVTFGSGACLGIACEGARKAALDELTEYLKKNKDALKALLTSLARFTPLDPLAGNPDSLFGRQMRANFEQGFTHKVSQIWGCGSSAFNDRFGNGIQVATAGDANDIFRDAQERQADLMAQNEFGIGLYAASTRAQLAANGPIPEGDVVTNNVLIPISYTAKLDSDPRKKIRFDLPLSASDTEGAKTYGLGMGLSYTHPLTDDWTLTPALGAGVTGSADLGSAGGARNYALTSAYTWRLDSFAISMGNSVGRYEALNLKIGDIEAAADIKNTVFTNGLMFSGPNSLIARGMVMEYTITDTRIRGDEVYTDGYDEVGVALGFFDTEMGVIDSYTKIGLGYLFGDGAQGSIDSLRLNLSSRF